MTTAFHKICRICSSPADYEIFAKIPTYLHATSNEFLNNNWQKPINILVEEVTGLKVTKDDALPCTICAICISYLKHAVTFREQAINNTMSLKVAQLLSAKSPKQSNDDNVEETAFSEDKASELITAQDLVWAGEERQVDVKQKINTLLQDQNKVNKQLLNNNRHSQQPSAQRMEEHMRYLNLLFNKDTNSGLTPKKRNTNCATTSGYHQLASSGGDGDGDEEFPTTTSSDDNEENDASDDKQKLCNIFSYQEKNFEEDDIMDLDELRNAIEVNRPENCKERKCRACSRRFMFKVSFQEHINTCIEYMFLTFIEEVNRLLEIRRSKAISPHEFIRRMIFSLRKTCEWLKANCDDMLMPGFSNNEVQQQKILESEDKATSSDEQKQQTIQVERPTSSLTANERLAQLVEGHQKRNKTKSTTGYAADLDFICVGQKIQQSNNHSSAAKDILLHDDNDDLSSLFATPKPKSPILRSQNILYEIERTQSRNSKPPSGNDSDLDITLPLQHQNNPLLATGNVITTTTTTTTATINITNTPQKSKNKVNSLPDEERLTFLQKLQKAASETTPISKTVLPATTRTPFIQVRKDLLCSAKGVTPAPPLTPTGAQTIIGGVANSTPPVIVPLTPTANKFSARCNPCDLLFETLAALEMHNAMKHNNVTVVKTNKPVLDLDAERKKIIALFEDDDDI